MLKKRLNRLFDNFSTRLDTYNRIEISKAAILDNVVFYENISKGPIAPVLKANAYGHGISQLAAALKTKNFPFIAVDGYFEALELRSLSKAPILVMGAIKPAEYKKLKLANIAFVVQNKESITALGNLGRPIKVHLEINTGMNRYGINPEQIDECIGLIKTYPALKLDGVMTHLADSDSENSRNTEESIALFDEVIDKILANGFKPSWIHAGQSTGSLRIKSKYANVSRIGLGLYGINPFPKNNPNYKVCQKLRPVMRFISAISHINELKIGDGVSYNYSFVAKKPMRVGVIPAGYYEGINRVLSNQGTVKIGNYQQPIVGKVCMNHTMFDLEGTDAQVGDEVVVYSENPEAKNSVAKVAASHGLSPYELLSNLSPTVRRQLVEDFK